MILAVCMPHGIMFFLWKHFSLLLLCCSREKNFSFSQNWSFTEEKCTPFHWVGLNRMQMPSMRSFSFFLFLFGGAVKAENSKMFLEASCMEKFFFFALSRSYTWIHEAPKLFSMETNKLMDKTFRRDVIAHILTECSSGSHWWSSCSSSQAYVKCIPTTSPSRRSPRDGGWARRYSTSSPGSFEHTRPRSMSAA